MAQRSQGCSPRSEGIECVCTVCTCGKHKCPQKHTSVHTRFGSPLSEYVAMYPEWPIEPPFQRKILPPEPSCHRMTSTTTYTDSYVNHPLPPPASCRPIPKIEDTGPFQNETTYNVDYWDKSAQMCLRMKAPQAQHVEKKKFEGQSVYQLEFPNHGYQPPRKQVIISGNLVLEGSKFDGVSTYHEHYREWQLPEKYVHKVQSNPPPMGMICGPTTYQSDYIERQIGGQCLVLSRGNPSNVCGDHMCYW